MIPYLVTPEEHAAQPAAVCQATLAVDALPEWLGRSYAKVMASLQAHHSYPVGPPFAQYSRRSDGVFDVKAGFPVRAAINGGGDGGVEDITLPGGTAATTMRVGSYADMVPGYQAIAGWIEAHNAVPLGDPWEVYLSDSESQPDPAQWLTRIVQPYRAATDS
jgi:effector-binding domain-containing protein